MRKQESKLRSAREILERLLDGNSSDARLSQAGREAISAAAKRRWATYRQQKAGAR